MGELAARGVDALATLGDLGRSEDEIAGALVAAGRTRVPVLALRGALETDNAFDAAVKGAQSQGVDIVNLDDNRVLDIGKIDIVTVPGYPVSPRDL